MFYGANGKLEHLAYLFIDENELWLNNCNYIIIRGNNDTYGNYIKYPDINNIVIYTNNKTYSPKMFLAILHEYYEAQTNNHLEACNLSLQHLQQIANDKHRNAFYEEHVKKIESKIPIGRITYNFAIDWSNKTVQGDYKNVAPVLDLYNGVITNEFKQVIHYKDLIDTQCTINCIVKLQEKT